MDINFSAYPRIAIVGSPGSGKSTLARQIAAETGHPLIHLDYEHHRAGWTHPSKEEWRRMNEAFIRGERWIIDGNHDNVMELHYRAADLVVFLHTPRAVCVWRMIRRQGKPRPDIKDEVIESEVFDLNYVKFLWFIWRYPRKGKQKIMALREQYPEVKFHSMRG